MRARFLATPAPIVVLMLAAGAVHPDAGRLHQESKGDSTGQELWTFDRLERIGGYETTVLGNPHVVETPAGKAVEFDGIDDALVVDVHPLAGAATFTWEAIFRPDGGEPAQRWLHLQEAGTDNRMLFEIRVAGDRWYFDSFVHSGAADKALINRERLHALGAWYHVAAVYDGREFRNYVDGVQEGAAGIHFDPQGAGRTSVGVRMNLVYYFKGAIRLARFTRRALPPGEFLRVSTLNPRG
jgi:Concanavalin A-like lectin/glucanases superfamily